MSVNSNSQANGSLTERRNQKMISKGLEKGARAWGLCPSSLAQKRQQREQMNEMAAQSYFGTSRLCKESGPEGKAPRRKGTSPREEIDSKNLKTGKSVVRIARGPLLYFLSWALRRVGSAICRAIRFGCNSD